MKVGKYLRIEWIENKPKTMVWVVKSSEDGEILGKISWYGAWRRYIFDPDGGGYGGAIFCAECLKDLSEFIQSQMDARKAKRKGGE